MLAITADTAVGIVFVALPTLALAGYAFRDEWKHHRRKVKHKRSRCSNENGV